MFVQIVLFTNNEMVVYLLDEDQNKYNYEADGIPSTYTRRKLYTPLGACIKIFPKDQQGSLQVHRYNKIFY